MVLSSVMMLDYLKEHETARAVENALKDVLLEGKFLTPDMGGNASTIKMAEEICLKIS